MNVIAKIPGPLYGEMFDDLQRRHPFAAERVGFAAGRLGTLTDGGRLLLLTHYHSIPDEHYINDQSVGARIGSEAITNAMQRAYFGRQVREGVFHVHLHGHHGETGMSFTDKTEIPRMIEGFRSVGRQAPHGIIILSLDHGLVWSWLPGNDDAVEHASVAVIGAPVKVFQRRISHER
jgi:hypothetical protein